MHASFNFRFSFFRYSFCFSPSPTPEPAFFLPQQIRTLFISIFPSSGTAVLASVQYFHLPCGFLLVERDLGESAGLGFGVSWLEEELWKLYSSSLTWLTTVLVSMPVFCVLESCCQDRMGDGPVVSPSWLLACQCVGTAGPELFSAQVTLWGLCAASCSVWICKVCCSLACCSVNVPLLRNPGVLELGR